MNAIQWLSVALTKLAHWHPFATESQKQLTDAEYHTSCSTRVWLNLQLLASMQSDMLSSRGFDIMQQSPKKNRSH